MLLVHDARRHSDLVTEVQPMRTREDKVTHHAVSPCRKRAMRTLQQEIAGPRWWVEHIQHVVDAYNPTPHSSTGYAPYYLMFGRQRRRPIDLLVIRICRWTASQSISVAYEKPMLWHVVKWRRKPNNARLASTVPLAIYHC